MYMLCVLEDMGKNSKVIFTSDLCLVDYAHTL